MPSLTLTVKMLYIVLKPRAYLCLNVGPFVNFESPTTQLPYAVLGLNIFQGPMNEHNEGAASGLNDCICQRVQCETSIVGDASTIPFPIPHVWANPSPSMALFLFLLHFAAYLLWDSLPREIHDHDKYHGAKPATEHQQSNQCTFLIFKILRVVIITLFH